MKEILKELDGKLTDEDLENIIEEVDEDGSGTLDFDGESWNFLEQLKQNIVILFILKPIISYM